MLLFRQRKKCLLDILLFEFFYKTFLLGLVHPILSQVLTAYLSDYSPTGAAYNADMFFSFLSPLGVVLFLLFLVISLVLVFYEYAVLIRLVSFFLYGQTYVLKEVLFTAYADLSLLKNRFFPLTYLYFVLLNPVIHSGYISSFVPVLQIPEFITGELQNTLPGTLAVLAFYLLLFAVYLLLLFVPIFMVLEQVPFLQAAKRALQHWKAIRLRAQLKIATLITLLFFTNYFIQRFLPYRLLTSGDFSWYFIRYLYNSEYFRYSFLEYLLMSVFWLAAELFLIGLLLRSYHSLHAEQNQGLANALPRKTRGVLSAGKKLGLRAKGTLQPHAKKAKEQLLASNLFRRHKKLWIACGCLLVYLVAMSYLNQGPLLHAPWIIGHRGDITAPENSVEGIRQASFYGADYVEIDVQLTSDNEVVVIHDSNLSRLTGASLNPAELTYSQLSELTITNRGKTAKIPTLREAITAAKEVSSQTGLLIEFKPQAGQSKQLVDQVEALVQELDFADRAIFMSMDMTAVSYLQEKQPQWWVGYCVFGALGKIDFSVGVDFLAVEQNQLSSSFLENARNHDLPVYVWTTDDFNDIFNYLRLGVSGIIGNSVENVSAAMSEYRSQDHTFYIHTGSGYPKLSEDGLSFEDPEMEDLEDLEDLEDPDVPENVDDPDVVS